MLQFYKGTHTPSIHIQPTHAHYTTIQRILHPESRIQFYMQKAKSSSNTTTTYRGQRNLHSRIQKRNSTHRRQGDLLEMHPCVTRTFHAFQPQDLPKGTPVTTDIPDTPVFPVFPDIPDIPVIHDLPAFPGNSTILQVPASPGIPPHYSIL